MHNMLTDHLSAISNPRNARWIGAGLFIVLLVLFGNQCLKLYEAFSFKPTIETVRTLTPAPSQQQFNATVISQANLFGNAPINPDQLQQINLPTTSLQLTLRGVFTSSNPQEASAIIERPDGQTRSFKVGTSVFGNSKLHAVFNDRIVLSTDGQLETLYFPDPSQSQAQNSVEVASVSALPSSLRNLVQQNMTAEEIQQTANKLTAPNITAEQRKQLIRQRLLELRNRARENRQ